MTVLIILLVVAAALAVATTIVLPHDGRGPGRPPTSHHDDVSLARFPTAR